MNIYQIIYEKYRKPMGIFFSGNFIVSATIFFLSEHSLTYINEQKSHTPHIDYSVGIGNKIILTMVEQQVGSPYAVEIPIA